MIQARSGDQHLEATTCDFCGGSEVELILMLGPLSVVRCASCGLIRTDPRPTQEHLLGRLSDASDRHIDRYQRFYLSPRMATYRRWLVNLESFRETNRLLDIGCGPGYFVDKASCDGWNSMGIDPSPSNVKFATDRGLKVLQGTADEAVALTAGGFDVVTFWDAFEHLADPVRVLAMVRSLLRPGGVVLMRLPDASVVDAPPSLSAFERPLYSFYTTYVFPWYPDRHLYHYSPETLSNLMTELGFRVLGSWRNEKTAQKALHASSWWKRQVKQVILKQVVHRDWPHQFVEMGAKPSDGP